VNEHAKFGGTIPRRALVIEDGPESEVGQQWQRGRGQSEFEEVASTGEAAAYIL